MQQILEIGTQIKIDKISYEIVDLIGLGAQSLIYKVKDKDNQIYALKHMRNCDISMIQTLEKLKEQKFQNVLNIISLEPFNKMPPYVDLYILSKLLKTTLQNFEDNIDQQDIINQSIIGLGEIFSIDAAHNDIKPDNIFYSIDKEQILDLKIGDFGLLSFEEKTKIEYFLQQGSKYYRAPEIEQYQDFIGISEKQANDVWGLGLTLYQVFTKENFYDSNYKLKFINQEFIDQKVSKLPKQYQPNVAGLLSLDPQSRLKYFIQEFKNLIQRDYIYMETIEKIKINLRREYLKPTPDLYNKIIQYLDNQKINGQKHLKLNEKMNIISKQIYQITVEDVKDKFNEIVQQLNK